MKAKRSYRTSTTDDGQRDIKMPQQITIIINNMTSDGGHLICRLFQNSQELGF
jgi:hypothetical protein